MDFAGRNPLNADVDGRPCMSCSICSNLDLAAACRDVTPLRMVQNSLFVPSNQVFR